MSSFKYMNGFHAWLLSSQPLGLCLLLQALSSALVRRLCVLLGLEKMDKEWEERWGCE